MALATSFVACGGGPPPTVRPTSTVEFETDSGSVLLLVDLATTEAERARGLQGVEELERGHGMAFVFDRPTTGSFWMKDTLIPLSIAFVGEDHRVIAVRDMEPCTADPCPTYGAGGAYVLAIETNLGWFDAAGIGVGSRAVLRGGIAGG